MKEKSLDLESIAEQYRPIVDQIRKEREQFGLTTPENIEIKVMFSNQANASAKDGILYVNPLSKIEVKDQKEAHEIFAIGCYFDQIMSFILGSPEPKENSLFFELLYGTKNFLEFRDRYKNAAEFEEAEQQFKKSKENILPLFMKYSSRFLDTSSKDIPNIIAHEVDHLDFEIKHKTEKEYIESLRKKIKPDEFNDLNLLKTYQSADFEFRSEIEARGIFFEEFRRFDYNPEKIEIIKNITKRRLNEYIQFNFISDYIGFLCEKEGEKGEIKDYADLIKLSYFVNATFNTNNIVNEHRLHLLENT
ncbi:MAG: hypothetical protein V3V78_04955, partial [Candidatus Woesearchaeota archaeon]